MSRDEITLPKKLVYRIGIGLVVLVIVLLLEWRFSVFNIGPSQNAANASQESLMGLMVGQKAPDFTLNILDGGQISLSALEGKAVLINFWASWCIPCREETPDLVRAYHAHHTEGLVILGVNLTSEDTMPEIKAFVEEFQMPYPVLLDQDGKVAALYRLPGIPTSVFINRQGVITRLQVGKMAAEQIEAFLAEILPDSK